VLFSLLVGSVPTILYPCLAVVICLGAYAGSERIPVNAALTEQLGITFTNLVCRVYAAVMAPFERIAVTFATATLLHRTIKSCATTWLMTTFLNYGANSVFSGNVYMVFSTFTYAGAIAYVAYGHVMASNHHEARMTKIYIGSLLAAFVTIGGFYSLNGLKRGERTGIAETITPHCGADDLEHKLCQFSQAAKRKRKRTWASGLITLLWLVVCYIVMRTYGDDVDRLMLDLQRMSFIKNFNDIRKTITDALGTIVGGLGLEDMFDMLNVDLRSAPPTTPVLDESKLGGSFVDVVSSNETKTNVRRSAVATEESEEPIHIPLPEKAILLESVESKGGLAQWFHRRVSSKTYAHPHQQVMLRDEIRSFPKMSVFELLQSKKKTARILRFVNEADDDQTYIFDVRLPCGNTRVFGSKNEDLAQAMVLSYLSAISLGSTLGEIFPDYGEFKRTAFELDHEEAEMPLDGQDVYNDMNRSAQSYKDNDAFDAADLKNLLLCQAIRRGCFHRVFKGTYRVYDFSVSSAIGAQPSKFSIINSSSAGFGYVAGSLVRVLDGFPVTGIVVEALRRSAAGQLTVIDGNDFSMRDLHYGWRRNTRVANLRQTMMLSVAPMNTANYNANFVYNACRDFYCSRHTHTKNTPAFTVVETKGVRGDVISNNMATAQVQTCPDCYLSGRIDMTELLICEKNLSPRIVKFGEIVLIGSALAAMLFGAYMAYKSLRKTKYEHRAPAEQSVPIPMQVLDPDLSRRLKSKEWESEHRRFTKPFQAKHVAPTGLVVESNGPDDNEAGSFLIDDVYEQQERKEQKAAKEHYGEKTQKTVDGDRKKTSVVTKREMHAIAAGDSKEHPELNLVGLSVMNILREAEGLNPSAQRSDFNRMVVLGQEFRSYAKVYPALCATLCKKTGYDYYQDLMDFGKAEEEHEEEDDQSHVSAVSQNVNTESIGVEGKRMERKTFVQHFDMPAGHKPQDPSKAGQLVVNPCALLSGSTMATPLDTMASIFIIDLDCPCVDSRKDTCFALKQRKTASAMGWYHGQGDVILPKHLWKFDGEIRTGKNDRVKVHYQTGAFVCDAIVRYISEKEDYVVARVTDMSTVVAFRPLKYGHATPGDPLLMFSRDRLGGILERRLASIAQGELTDDVVVGNKLGSKFICHTVSGRPGNSGAPIFAIQNGQARVVAMYTGGLSDKVNVGIPTELLTVPDPRSSPPVPPLTLVVCTGGLAKRTDKILACAEPFPLAGEEGFSPANLQEVVRRARAHQLLWTHQFTNENVVASLKVHRGKHKGNSDSKDPDYAKYCQLYGVPDLKGRVMCFNNLTQQNLRVSCDKFGRIARPNPDSKLLAKAEFFTQQMYQRHIRFKPQRWNLQRAIEDTDMKKSPGWPFDKIGPSKAHIASLPNFPEMMDNYSASLLTDQPVHCVYTFNPKRGEVRPVEKQNKARIVCCDEIRRVLQTKMLVGDVARQLLFTSYRTLMGNSWCFLGLGPFYGNWDLMCRNVQGFTCVGSDGGAWETTISQSEHEGFVNLMVSLAQLTGDDEKKFRTLMHTAGEAWYLTTEGHLRVSNWLHMSGTALTSIFNTYVSTRRTNYGILEQLHYETWDELNKDFQCYQLGDDNNVCWKNVSFDVERFMFTMSNSFDCIYERTVEGPIETQPWMNSTTVSYKERKVPVADCVKMHYVLTYNCAGGREALKQRALSIAMLAYCDPVWWPHFAGFVQFLGAPLPTRTMLDYLYTGTAPFDLPLTTTGPLDDLAHASAYLNVSDVGYTRALLATFGVGAPPTPTPCEQIKTSSPPNHAMTASVLKTPLSNASGALLQNSKQSLSVLGEANQGTIKSPATFLVSSLSCCSQTEFLPESQPRCRTSNRFEQLYERHQNRLHQSEQPLQLTLNNRSVHRARASDLNLSRCSENLPSPRSNQCCPLLLPPNHSYQELEMVDQSQMLHMEPAIARHDTMSACEVLTCTLAAKTDLIMSNSPPPQVTRLGKTIMSAKLFVHSTSTCNSLVNTCVESDPFTNVSVSANSKFTMNQHDRLLQQAHLWPSFQMTQQTPSKKAILACDKAIRTAKVRIRRKFGSATLGQCPISQACSMLMTKDRRHQMCDSKHKLNFGCYLTCRWMPRICQQWQLIHSRSVHSTSIMKLSSVVPRFSRTSLARPQLGRYLPLSRPLSPSQVVPLRHHVFGAAFSMRGMRMAPWQRHHPTRSTMMAQKCTSFRQQLPNWAKPPYNMARVLMYKVCNLFLKPSPCQLTCRWNFLLSQLPSPICKTGASTMLQAAHCAQLEQLMIRPATGMRQQVHLIKVFTSSAPTIRALQGRNVISGGPWLCLKARCVTCPCCSRLMLCRQPHVLCVTCTSQVTLPCQLFGVKSLANRRSWVFLNVYDVWNKRLHMSQKKKRKLNWFPNQTHP